MTFSIVLLPKVWMIQVIAGADGISGMVFPTIWLVYTITIFVASGLTFSWLIRKS